MQYFGAGGALRFHTTYEQYVRDLDHLLKGLHNLKSLCLTGGEPLMHKDIGRIALYANSKHKVKAIYIVTNTTIVPDEETLTVFGKCHKLKVLFSDYTSNSALLERLKPDELAAALDRHGVRHWKYAAGTVWQDLGDARYRDYSPEEAAALYKACVTSTYCNALFDGKVGACPRGVNITGLGGWIDARDFIDIRANDTPRERRARWVEYFSTDHPSLCQYCNRMHERKIIPVAEQMSHD
jgi:hypothetical protein